MKSSLEWATIKLLQTREFVLFFTTMHHKAKLSQWITKEKSFPSWHVRADADTHQRRRIPSSELMHPLHQFRVCIVQLVLACTVRPKTQKTKTLTNWPSDSAKYEKQQRNNNYKENGKKSTDKWNEEDQNGPGKLRPGNLRPGKLRPKKLRPGKLRAVSVTSRHLVRDRSREKVNSSPFFRNTCFQNK